MIKINKNISGVFIGTKACSFIANGVVVVYSAIKSCFGSGVWKDNSGWINNDAWK